MPKNDKEIHVLLVEDDLDFSEALTARLEKREFKVTKAFNAEEALKNIEHETFEAVIADIKLPGMDGMEFLEKVRVSHPDLPVIMLTGYANLESAKKAVTLDAAAYILKPLEGIDELLNPVNKAIHGYRLLKKNKALNNWLLSKISELEKSEKHLLEQKNTLEEKNIALRELMEQVRLEGERIKSEISANIDNLIIPLVMRIQKRATSVDKKYIEMLKRNLEEITLSFGREISGKTYRLSPREIEICNMIRSGLRSKEISKLLNVSVQTAERHRNNIRKKLGIVKKGVNLATYLQNHL